MVVTSGWPRRSLLLLGLLVAAGCGQAVPSPPPTGTAPVPSATTTPAPSASPAVPTLVIAGRGDLAGGPSDAATGADAQRVAEFTHDGVYGLDDRLRPVPVLAREPATVSADGRTWTIRLRDDVAFHDGTPLRADDVVAMYQLAMSPRCPFGTGSCQEDRITTVTRVDDLTVAFTLAEPTSAFAADGLRLGIESKAAIDAAYATFRAGAAGVSAADTADFLAAVATEESRPTGPAGADGRPTIDYARFRGPGEALLERAGLPLPLDGPDGDGAAVDVGRYVRDVVARVRAVDATFTSRPVDALAAAYPYLPTAAAPVTTGPFRLVSVSAAGDVELAANAAYALGRPAIDRVVLRAFPTDAAAASALAAGEVDWWPTVPATSPGLEEAGPGIRAIGYPDLGFYGMTFDLHPEAKSPFLDRNLRQAVALCFDHAATVDLATGGRGLPIDTEIPTMSWAFPSTGLTTYAYDPARARTLIEASGWSRGADGIYERDGQRLSTVVPVREDAPERVAWLRAVSEAVRTCGIDLRVGPVPFADILKMLAVYPHVNAAAPEDGRPFEAYVGGLDVDVDPDPFRLYHSSQCSSAERPDTYAFGCYSSPEVDRLIEAGRATTDLERRAAIYREYAARISEDLPVIYGWTDRRTEAIGPAVGTTAPGGLPLDTPTWYRPTERLTVTR